MYASIRYIYLPCFFITQIKMAVIYKTLQKVKSRGFYLKLS